MILIEVIFGAINGNPISIDNALDTTSTNPVENRVIAAALAEVMNTINHVQDELDDKEVENFETKAALDAYIQDLIDDEDQDAIDAAQEKLYYAADTNTLYKFDGTELHPVESDYIIVSGSQTDLNAALAPYTTRGVRKVIWINGTTTTLYVFTTEGTTKKLTQTLSYRTGYKYRTCSNPTAATPTWGAWTTKTYSYTGHTHTSANITDLGTTIATAIAGKQDSTPAAGSLTTTATTIVGAINEVNGKASAQHIVAINLYDDEVDFAQWHNLLGRTIKILAIAKNNLSTVYISDGGSIVHQNIETLLQNGPIEIANNSQITLDVVRTATGFASLTLTYEIA